MSFQVVTCLQPFFSVQSNFFQSPGVDPVSTLRVHSVSMEVQTLANNSTGGWGKWEEVGQRVQMSSYRIRKFRGFNVQHGDYS